ncbi:uncharacterized protein L203_100193 [Cryptococcus depauperatus CBS 7841]|uniref:TROVE domain-containing protein n=1 Tax=Cryptococcus depauperatus CBS 7841 TaxID=1295531 RepID=A0A1E3IZG0_9TREE|nr:hypothetical protein L203_00147 [Cryptococcus depauperatus CBS 7841]
MLPASTSKSGKDWSLPATFLELLASPYPQILDELIPANPPTPPLKLSELALESEPHPFIDALRTIPDTYTEKGALAYKSTSSHLVDLFFDFSPGIKPERLFELLEDSWKEDSLATLKIIFHARSIHEGKGFKDGYFRAVGWLWQTHPRTFLENLHLLVAPTCPHPVDARIEAKKHQRQEDAELQKGKVLDLDDMGNVELEQPPVEYSARPHGTFDDLLDLLVLHINGQLSPSFSDMLSAVDEALAPVQQEEGFKNSRIASQNSKGVKRDRSGFAKIQALAAKRIEKDPNDFVAKLWKTPSPIAKHALLADRLKQALSTDKKLQALYLTVVHIFEQYLVNDLALLHQHQEYLVSIKSQAQFSPHLASISFAAKWAPTPGKSADKQLHIATAIAMKHFPGIDVLRARELFQKKVLSPLRNALSIPEIQMSNGSWKIDYTKVPSRAMARHASSFADHDSKSFQIYLDKVASGRASISGASRMPHELLFNAVNGKDVITKRIADLQWATLVNSIRSSSMGTITNSIAIADVSGSMGSYEHAYKTKDPAPILPCLALTLLLAELASPPWQGCFFTFSTDPKCEFIDTSLPLSERASKLSNAQWGMSTEFYKTYELILETAQREELAPENMIKVLFVFSDMQFDGAVGNSTFGETEHQTMKRRFEEAGYVMPEMVYWNLAPRANGTPKPVKSNVEGVTLFSGFSGALMKFFFGQDGDVNEDDDDLMANYEKVDIKEAEGNEANETKDKRKTNPLDQVHKAIGTKPFQDLKVFD